MKMINKLGKRHEGHDPSLMALGVLGVMMMAAVIGVVAMDGDGTADAAVGSQFVVGDLRYTIIAEGKVDVIDLLSTSTSTMVRVPSSVSYEGTTYNVNAIRSMALASSSKLTTLIISDGVTSIGERACSGCSNLRSVSIPDSVTSIGSYAFFNCSSLTSITIPDGVTSIENHTFYNCSNLSSVSIPDSVTSIGGSAFAYCSHLSRLTIPDSVTSIGSSAFYNCSYLSSLTIPDSVTSIGGSAFYNCSNLYSVSISNSVTTIEDFAFNGCSSLMSVTFESTEVPELGAYSFSTGTTINVNTPGWDPVTAMAGAIGTDGKTKIVWANEPEYPALTFESDPVADGIIAYITRETP